MAKRTRPNQILFFVSDDEKRIIQSKMAQLGTKNMGAYLRKMAIDGYTVRLDIPELKEILSLLRYAGNNLNQLTRRVHETGRIYDADLADIKDGHNRILDAVEEVVKKVSVLK